MMRFSWVLFTGLILISACQNEADLVQRTDYGRAQGSTYALSYIAPRDVRFQESIDSILEVIDKSMSIYRDDSDISALNQGEQIILDSHFRRVLDRSNKVYLETEGVFDISVLPLMKLWNFERKNQRIPDSSAIALAMEKIGWSKVHYTSGDSFVLPEGMLVDVNAIAQGYTVDVIAEFLEAKGVEHYLVEVGGELRAKGANIDGQVWRIGIEKPHEDNPEDRFQRIIELNNASLATSGSYRKFIEDTLTGRRYSHAIDPFSGMATNDPLMSVTVIAPTGIDADAYATALLVMGLEKARIWMNKDFALPVYLIYFDQYSGWKEELNDAFNDKIITLSN
jgi:FAD:protein FMN transferase